VSSRAKVSFVFEFDDLVVLAVVFVLDEDSPREDSLTYTIGAAPSKRSLVLLPADGNLGGDTRPEFLRWPDLVAVVVVGGGGAAAALIVGLALVGNLDARADCRGDNGDHQRSEMVFHQRANVSLNVARDLRQ
jgi:hypothetical protein